MSRFALTYLALLVSTLLLGGCTSTYLYNQVTYATASEALSAQRAELHRIIQSIEESEKRIGGKAIVLIPSFDVFRKNGVVTTGGANAEQINYIARTLEIGTKTRYYTLERSKVFDTVIFKQVSNTKDANWDGFDFKVYLHSPAFNQFQWYVESRDGKSPVAVNAVQIGTFREIEESFIRQIVNGAFSNPETASNNQKQLPTDSSTLKVTRTGSSFFINSSGYAVTNAHVVSDCSRVEAAVGDRLQRIATIVAVDRQNDLAVVKVGSSASDYSKIRIEPSVEIGESVTVFGFPLSTTLSSTGNLSTGIVSALAGIGNDTSKYQVSAPVQAGNSGGPVYDERGALIAVVQSKLNALATIKYLGDLPQNVNFAIKQNVLIEFLKANKISYEVHEGIKKLSLVEIGRLAQRQSLRLVCFN